VAYFGFLNCPVLVVPRTVTFCRGASVRLFLQLCRASVRLFLQLCRFAIGAAVILISYFCFSVLLVIGEDGGTVVA
jgi:hypothetical protein